GEDLTGRYRGAWTAGRDNRNRRSAQRTNGGRFAPRVADQLPSEALLDLEDRVHTLGRDVQSGVVRKDQRRVQIVVDCDVDLPATAAVGIDDKSGRGAVSLGQ